jgi:hypothetical protein
MSLILMREGLTFVLFPIHEIYDLTALTHQGVVLLIIVISPTHGTLLFISYNGDLR